jgi:hypothetical protein
MLAIIRAGCYLLQVAHATTGLNMLLTSSQQAPSGSTLLGTTTVVQTGFVKLEFSRGSGPTKVVVWNCHWSAAGS